MAQILVILPKKQEIESLTNEFITMLKSIKKSTQTLEEGIRSLFFNNNKTPLNELSEITDKLSMLLHYFSEESLCYHPKFLKFNVLLAQNICLVKKCLYTQFIKFFEELEINYNNLEGEMEFLLEMTQSVKNRKSKKQLEERLTL